MTQTTTQPANAYPVTRERSGFYRVRGDLFKTEMGARCAIRHENAVKAHRAGERMVCLTVRGNLRGVYAEIDIADAKLFARMHREMFPTAAVRLHYGRPELHQAQVLSGHHPRGNR